MMETLDLNELSAPIVLNDEHHKCIVQLINQIIAKSPHLQQLNYESVVFVRLVAVISLIETTLCSKYQVLLKRNSSLEESIDIIKSWLRQYYKHSFVDSLCQTMNGNNESANNDDMALMALMILSIAHKLRVSLPRINAYFDPDWQSLDQFDDALHQMTNCDKLLELVQNELCLKRKQLEVTRSKVSQLQSTLNSKLLHVNKEKRSKIDYHSNLFAEYEDDGDSGANIVFAEESGDDIASDEMSNESVAYVDHLSDDDYIPGKKMARLSSGSTSAKTAPPKKSYYKKSYRGRGRPPKDAALMPITITPPVPTRGRGRPPKPKPPPVIIETDDIDIDFNLSKDRDSNGEFECEICGKTFAKEYRLTRHTFTHKGHKQFLCDWPDCNESFDLKWKLSEHRQEHSGDGEDDESFGNNHTFECEWADCGDSFQSKRELTIHEHEQHANRSTSKYSCDWPQCREIFENKIDWRKHVKTHGKIGESSKTFDEESDKSLKKKHFDPIGETHLQCKTCQKLFSYKSGWSTLNYHVNTHLNVDKIFNYNSAINIEMSTEKEMDIIEEIHESESIKTCEDESDKSLKKKHFDPIGETHLQCKTCQKLFSYKSGWSTLNYHVNKHQNVDKTLNLPTECGFPGCHKSFYKLESLENHRKIHETFSINDLS